MSFGTPALLSVQALAVFFLGMLSITNSFLQSHNLERKPIISILAGSAVKLITSFFLIGNPDIQILGAPIGTLLCYITIVVFNFFFVAKHIGFVPKFGRVFIRPLLASVICAAAAFGSFKLFEIFLPSKIAVLAAILAAVLVYAAAVLLFRAITEDELKMLPKGEKIANKLRRIGIMK